jgi:hypothetical protein
VSGVRVGDQQGSLLDGGTFTAVNWALTNR